MKWKQVDQAEISRKGDASHSHWKANKTGSGSNSAGVVEDVETLILSADKTLTDNVRISQMFESSIVGIRAN